MYVVLVRIPQSWCQFDNVNSEFTQKSFAGAGEPIIWFAVEKKTENVW